MAQISTDKCGICSDNASSFFCYQCHDKLCPECLQWHAKFFSSKNHVVLDLQTVDKVVLNTKLDCEKHNNDLIYFCDKCQCLICCACVVDDHQTHILKNISDVVSEYRAKLGEHIQDLKGKMKALADEIETLEVSRLMKIQNESEHFSTEVNEVSNDMISIIKDVTSIPITQVTDFRESEKSVVKDAVDKLQKTNADYSLLCEKLENILSLQHDIAVLVNGKSALNELENIAEIPVIKKEKSLKGFNKNNFAEEIIKQIHAKYGARYLDEKDAKIKQLGTQLMAAKSKCSELQVEILTNVRAEEEKKMTQSTLVSKYPSLFGKTLQKRGIVCIVFGRHYSFAVIHIPDLKNINLLKEECVPTSILINAKEECVAFGNEAEKKFAILSPKQKENYFFFGRFPVLIDQNIFGHYFSPTIMDTLGKKMLASKVFMLAIKYILQLTKEKITKMNQEDTRINKLDIKDLHFILTHPANWKGTAENLLKEAASWAGIHESDFSLEIDNIAILHGLYLEDQFQLILRNNEIRFDISFMIVNLEGNEGKIFVYKICSDCLIKETVPLVQGPWCIDSAFNAIKSFISNVLGEEAIGECIKTNPNEFYNFLVRFICGDHTKRLYRKQLSSKLPVSLLPITKDDNFRSITKGLNIKEIFGDLCIGTDIFEGLFKPIIANLIRQIETIRNTQDVFNILLNDEFSLNPIIKNAFVKHFGHTISIFTPTYSKQICFLVRGCTSNAEFKLKK